ncbi:MAG: hypothetical protein GF398_04355, partial [Chitinivibrionales bacterium]|nr:hypothetical protein [Chitinivibrionales bacterium]
MKSFLFVFVMIFALSAQHEGLTDAILSDQNVTPNNYPWTPMTHGHAIDQTHSGTLVVGWFGGSEENHDDLWIWVTRKEPGKEWETPYSPTGQGNTGQPCIFQSSDPDAPLLLYENCWKANPSRMRFSTDEGTSWSDAIDTPLRTTSKNRPLEIKGG